MDVSLSMRVNNVKPSRLAAAQAPAKLFLAELLRGIEVGLVTFASSSQVGQTALDREPLITAIKGFQMPLGTATGSAIVMCVAELFADHCINLEALNKVYKSQSRSLDDEKKPPKWPLTAAYASTS